MNDITLMRKNLFRKPVRTSLLLISILIAFLIFSVMLSFNAAFMNFKTLPNRMVTLSKINFTESLPMAHYDRVAHTDGVLAATHMNWFGGYYRDPRNFLPVFAVDPPIYFRVYSEDLHIPAAERDVFFCERTVMFVVESVAKRFNWHVGQRIPFNSNIYINGSNGTHVWDFVLVGIIPTPEGSSQTGSVLIHYDYFNDTITFSRDHVGWIPFLTTSATVNDRVAHAIDARFANSADETLISDEAIFNKAFIAQIGPIALIITLVVSAVFVVILFIVGTTMALVVRGRIGELGVMKMLGFFLLCVLCVVFGGSLLFSFLGVVFGMFVGVGLLVLFSKASGGNGPPICFAMLSVFLFGAVIALTLGLIIGLPPAFVVCCMRIVNAFVTC